MPSRLKEYQDDGDITSSPSGDNHFITVSCYHRQPYFGTPQAKGIALRSFEAMRQHYEFEVLGYVVMPEHVHLLLSEPPDHDKYSLAKAPHRHGRY